jgi:hypothetical protein
LTGATGETGTAGADNITAGATGAIGVTGATGIGATGAVGYIDSITTSQTTMASSEKSSISTPFFVTNEVGSITVSAGQKVLVRYWQEFGNSAIANIAFTIGRGTDPTPTTDYVNLANDTKFSTTELDVMTSSAQYRFLRLALAHRYYNPGSKPSWVFLTKLDTPGSGTFYYCPRIKGYSGNMRIYNSYMELLII